MFAQAKSPYKSKLVRASILAADVLQIIDCNPYEC